MKFVNRYFSFFVLVAMLLLLIPFTHAEADDYAETIAVFKSAGESGQFFNSSVGFAVFPTIGKGAVSIGGAYGSGRVYKQGRHIGDTKMTQVTVGSAFGGQAYSQIIFSEDERALIEFTSGNFEFGAQAAATTTGTSAGASGGQHDAETAGKYNNGVATFTVAKGGLMYEASIGG
jgi:hypothetical protein